MLKKFILLGGTVSLGSAIAMAQAPHSPEVLFGARETIHDIDISPDGNKLVYVAPGPGASSIIHVADLAEGNSRPISRSSGNPETLRRCDFVSNSRLVCSVTALIDINGELIPFSRLNSLNIDGSDAKPLGQQASFYDSRLRQFDGSILDWLPGQGDAVLMSREYVPEAGKGATRLVRNRDGLGVDRVDVKTLKSETVEAADRTASYFMSDGRGTVRIKTARRVAGATGQLTSQTAFFYRKMGSSRWEPLGSYDSNTGEGIWPLAVDASLDSAYVLQKLNGRDALYRMKLDGSMALELAYANDKVDVDNVVRIGKGARVIGVTFAEEKRSVIYFDAEYAQLAAALSKAIPNLPLVRFVGSSEDNNTLLIYAGSDTDPGRYYTYDKAKRALNETMLVRPHLENVTLASMKPVSYPSGDGTSIPAYLSVPPGKEAMNLPTIVMPHGGPSARDEWGFDWLTQYLVAKGYAVLQPNYRGSSGYGDEWMNQNGFQGWRTSIGDITAGAKWMVSEGIADPSRLAILGWSYGGYAALQSAVTEPDLYKAVVAIAPVTDLDLLKQEAEGFTNAKLVAQYIGSGSHVREGSPLQNVARISKPVLLFHGERDFNVGVSHSRRMDKALQAAGKKSELHLYPDLEHSLVDSQVRIKMLGRIGSFLEDELRR